MVTQTRNFPVILGANCPEAKEVSAVESGLPVIGEPYIPVHNHHTHQRKDKQIPTSATLPTKIRRSIKTRHTQPRQPAFNRYLHFAHKC